tara:strand:+ start:37 stop:288 length:252 start_codon:yes stop_codon:yes gene_type:complete
MMTDVQLKALALSLSVAKDLLRETPLVYTDMECAALRHIFATTMQRQMATYQVAELLGYSEQEIIDKMATVAARMAYEQYGQQ